VVEVPAVGDVVPADEPDPELLLVLADLARKDSLHEELEERIAAAADGEEGREDGHRSGEPPGPGMGPAILPRRDRRPARRTASAPSRRRSPSSPARPRRPRARPRSASRCPADDDGPRGGPPRRGAAGR